MPIFPRVFSGILSKEYQAFYDDGVRAFFAISNSLDPLSSVRKSSNIACRLPGWWLVVHGGLLRENCCILKKMSCRKNRGGGKEKNENRRRLVWNKNAAVRSVREIGSPPSVKCNHQRLTSSRSIDRCSCYAIRGARTKRFFYKPHLQLRL